MSIRPTAPARLLWTMAGVWAVLSAPSGEVQPAERPKTLRSDDVTANEGFETTEGLDLIWKLQADPSNVVLSSVTAELAGLVYYDSEYRWPAVRGARGSISVKVPRAGKFHPAIVVYDTAGRETYELLLDGKHLGRFTAAEDDRRQRLHFLSRPIEFRGGEKLTFLADGSGSHVTEDVLLLAARPPVRGRLFEVRHVEAVSVHESGHARLRLTWITTWPSACTIEYGPTEAYGRQIAEKEALANHRLDLADAAGGPAVHYRITAPRPGGTSVTASGVYRAERGPIVGTAVRENVPLQVENPYDCALSASPVTSGVPFAQGELAGEGHVRLLDGAGREIPVQPKVTSRWPDGSVKWLLISFLADARPKTAEHYALEYGREVRPAAAPTKLRHTLAGLRLRVETGPLEVEMDGFRAGLPTAIRFDANADGSFADDEQLTPGLPLAAQLVDAAGTRYTTNRPVERLEVEELGPVRMVVKVRGRHGAPSGQTMFAYATRLTFWADSPTIHLEHTWTNDSAAPFTSFEAIGLEVPLARALEREWTIGLGGRSQSSGRGEMALTQLGDTSFELTPKPAPTPAHGAATQRAEGWIDVVGPTWGLTAAVRDFWQLYPKALRLTGSGLAIDLCPDFPDGTYDKSSKLDEIKLYYYLMGGKYKVARGMRKQHDLLLHFHPATPAADGQARQIAEAFQEPLLAACSPERYAGTRVFGEILPATTGRWPEYEKVCERVYQGYVRHREASHELGMLNFGDQWGERKVNWANGEYDHHHAFLMQYARTADRKWYFLGQQAVRHAIDVDTCHDGPHRGGEWIHAMGHTGGYFTEPYQGEGIPRGGMSVSHTWTEGFYDWYALSGDPTAAENAAEVADYYDGAYLNNYDWDNCRTNGWHLLLTMAAYRATGDRYYLNAARIIVERTLERQTPGGGWHRQMVPGHCHDMPRHRGEANFMLGVLANGLEEYYREVPDPRVAEAIQGGARQAVKELWVEQASGFRYTSCPNMTGYTANNDMTAEILFFAHRLHGEPEFARIAAKAMQAAFRDGIGSIAHLRWTPHILYNMDLLRQAGK